MNVPPPGPVAAPPRKKSGNGCVVALIVVGALALLLLVGGGVALYAFSRSSAGKAVFGTIGDMTQLMQEAQNAPGTREVRALGCDQALAMDFDRMQRILEDRLDAATSKPGPFSTMVVCQVGVFAKTPPSCDAVARAYLTGAPEPARGFTVTVQRGSGSHNAICSTLYEPDGTKVKDLAPGSTPSVPGGSAGK